jgi:hypothetical protein
MLRLESKTEPLVAPIHAYACMHPSPSFKTQKENGCWLLTTRAVRKGASYSPRLQQATQLDRGWLDTHARTHRVVWDGYGSVLGETGLDLGSLSQRRPGGHRRHAREYATAKLS